MDDDDTILHMNGRRKPVGTRPVRRGQGVYDDKDWEHRPADMEGHDERPRPARRIYHQASKIGRSLFQGGRGGY